MKKILALLLILLCCGVLFAKEYKIPNDDDIEIGKLKNEGWEVTVYEGTFPKNSVLIIEEIKIPKCPVKGKQLEIKLKGHEKEFVHFQKPVKLTVKMEDTKRPQDYLFGYYDGDKKFHCYIPDRVEIKEGYMVYTINHFTGWFGGEGDKEEVINTMVNDVARENWEKENLKNGVKNKTSKYLDQMFKEMKITDAASRTKLVADFFSMMEGDETKGLIDFTTQNINNLKDGDYKSVVDATIKYTSENLLRVLKKDTKIATIPANLFGNLSAAAGYIAEGDKEDALKEIGKAMRNCDATTEFCSQLADIGREKANNIINFIAQKELEDCYQLYIGNGVEWRHLDEVKGDIDYCVSYLGIGGGISNVKAIESYAKQLGMDPVKDHDFLVNKARKDLEAYFKSRQSAEGYIKKNKPAIRELIDYLDKEGLLNRYGAQDYFNDSKKFDLKFRLQRLFTIRKSILGYIDPLERKYVTHEEMANLIKKYVEYVGDGHREKFFEYLIAVGYCKKATGFDKPKQSLEDKLNKIADDLNKFADSLGGNKPKEKPKETKKTEKADTSKVTAKGCYVLDSVEVKPQNNISPSKSGQWSYSDKHFKLSGSVTTPPKVIYPGDTISFKKSLSVTVDKEVRVNSWININVSGYYGCKLKKIKGDNRTKCDADHKSKSNTEYITYQLEKVKGGKNSTLEWSAQVGIDYYSKNGPGLLGVVVYKYKWKD